MSNRRWTKPETFDNNIIVIGGGSAGLVAAYIAAVLRAKVTLVERHAMGGDCLNTGCVPSKALIHVARLWARAREAEGLGLKIQGQLEFADIMAYVQKTIAAVAPHDSVERYARLGVEVIRGDACLLSPWQVGIATEAGRRLLTARSIIIAAGARPLVPPIPGLDGLPYLTSDTVWNLREKPKHLLVLGGGPIGCELAQAFARLGSRVTLLEMAPRLLAREDPEASALVADTFRREGIDVRLNHTAKSFNLENGEISVIADSNGQPARIAFDQVLIALGRSATVAGYGLEDLGVSLSPQKTVAVDFFQATNFDNIFACGDVAGPYQFTHVASHQAWYAAVNALFGNFKKFRTDYRVIPWAIFTDPEIARVGLTEAEADDKGIACETSRYDMADLDRAITENKACGFVKVLTKPGTDKILGATVAGENAGELIAEFVLAMKHNLGLNKLLNTIHVYPTWMEANKYAAGIWKKNHQPDFLLKCLAYFHRWRRGR